MTRTDPGRTVLIADSDFGDVDIERAIVEGAGLRLVAAQCKSEDEVIEAGREAGGILTQYARVGSRAIDALPHCRVIARYGTGVDIVDVDAATRHGVQVTNAPNDWCADEVADHAVALWLAAARKICRYDGATRRGEWHWKTGRPIHRLRGQVLGLLSFGVIARLVAERAQAFGVEVWAHDRSSTSPRSAPARSGRSPSTTWWRVSTTWWSRHRSPRRRTTPSTVRRSAG
ncbi:Glyoxylate_hydroxypyruvate reductase B [Streptomyces sp. enrichment culture]